MAQRDYERILASLKVRLNHVKHVDIIKPVKVTDYKNVDNKLNENLIEASIMLLEKEETRRYFMKNFEETGALIKLENLHL